MVVPNHYGVILEILYTRHKFRDRPQCWIGFSKRRPRSLGEAAEERGLGLEHEGAGLGAGVLKWRQGAVEWLWEEDNSDWLKGAEGSRRGAESSKGPPLHHDSHCLFEPDYFSRCGSRKVPGFHSNSDLMNLHCSASILPTGAHFRLFCFGNYKKKSRQIGIMNYEVWVIYSYSCLQ